MGSSPKSSRPDTLPAKISLNVLDLLAQQTGKVIVLTAKGCFVPGEQPVTMVCVRDAQTVKLPARTRNRGLLALNPYALAAGSIHCWLLPSRRVSPLGRSRAKVVKVGH
jgi:hypothetical protein